MNFSMNIAPFPNAASASEDARWNISRTSSICLTTLIPEGISTITLYDVLQSEPAFVDYIITRKKPLTSTTSAVGSLEDDREPVLVAEFLGLIGGCDGSIGSWDDGDSSLDSSLSGSDLVSGIHR